MYTAIQDKLHRYLDENNPTHTATQNNIEICRGRYVLFGDGKRPAGCSGETICPGCRAGPETLRVVSGPTLLNPIERKDHAPR